MSENISFGYPQFAEEHLFVCDVHTPSHWTSQLSEAMELTRVQGCSKWKLHDPYTSGCVIDPSAASLRATARQQFETELAELNTFAANT